ncbi:hypothetical protein A7975_13105 [Bacillus sp. FJAT-26390]|nr:hypothetical protein A7975_13105 [Bacillus sp. FJAT-26390]
MCALPTQISLPFVKMSGLPHQVVRYTCIFIALLFYNYRGKRRGKEGEHAINIGIFERLVMEA